MLTFFSKTTSFWWSHYVVFFFFFLGVLLFFFVYFSKLSFQSNDVALLLVFFPFLLFALPFSQCIEPTLSSICTMKNLEIVVPRNFTLLKGFLFGICCEFWRVGRYVVFSFILFQRLLFFVFLCRQLTIDIFTVFFYFFKELVYPIMCQEVCVETNLTSKVCFNWTHHLYLRPSILSPNWCLTWPNFPVNWDNW